MLVRESECIQFRLGEASEGLNLGMQGGLDQAGSDTAVPKFMPTPSLESDLQNGEGCKWVDLGQAVRVHRDP